MSFIDFRYQLDVNAMKKSFVSHPSYQPKVAGKN